MASTMSPEMHHVSRIRASYDRHRKSQMVVSPHRYASPTTDRSRGWDLTADGGSPTSVGKRKMYKQGGPLNRSYDVGNPVGRGTAYQS